MFFWPRRASTTLEVKNDHAHVTTQRILKKVIELNFSVGCMVWLSCCLFQPLTTMSLINKILKTNCVNGWARHDFLEPAVTKIKENKRGF